MIEFIREEDHLCIEIMLWLVDLIGFNDDEQKEILYFAFKKRKTSKNTAKTEGNKENV